MKAESPLIRPTLLRGKPVSDTVILLFPEFLLTAFLSAYTPEDGCRHVADFPFGDTSLYAYANATIVGPVFGSVSVAFVLENLIAEGAKRVIAFGSAGRLAHEGDVALSCVRSAYNETGVGRAYVASQDILPSTPLTNDVETTCSRLGYTYEHAHVLTYDAPYRETPSLVRRFMAKGANAIDMETGALFAVAHALDVHAACVLIYSDRVDPCEGRWQTFFKSKAFKQERARMIRLIAATAQQTKA